MNTVKIFAEGVAQQIKDYLPEKYQNMICEVRVQEKNNVILRNGIVFKIPGQKLAPVIYMEQFYDMVRNGEPLKQIMEQIAEECQKAFNLNKQADKIKLEDYTDVKECLSSLSIQKKIRKYFQKYRTDKWRIYLQSAGLNFLLEMKKVSGVLKLQTAFLRGGVWIWRLSIR